MFGLSLEEGHFIISEPGLYRWSCTTEAGGQGVPTLGHTKSSQIRRTGGYIPTSESDSDEDIMAGRACRAEDHRTQEPTASSQGRADQGAGAEGEVRGCRRRVRWHVPGWRVGEDAPAERMDIGQNRLFRLLQADGYSRQVRPNRNVPTPARWISACSASRRPPSPTRTATLTVSRTPKVTGKAMTHAADAKAA